MRILLLSRYEDLGASSRMRTYKYLPYLEKQGMAITVAPLLSNAYLQTLYQAHRRDPRTTLAAYLRRVRQLTSARRYDLLWIEKELFPMLPAWVERFLNALKIPYVVDYDDATFHSYDLHQWAVVRRLMGHKIDAVMRGAVLVVVGNTYLAARARQAGARGVEIIPTVVDVERYAIRDEGNNPSVGSDFTVGWIGSPATAKYLDVIQPALAFLQEIPAVRCVFIGSGPVDMGEVPVEIRAWTEETEAANVASLDVGVMPLVDSPWERGKCGYKLIQYMACGLPVVASPVGMNRDIIQHGENGFLAESTEDWVKALRTLQTDPALRRRMGQAGRQLVEAHYSLQINAPRLAELLQQSAAQPRR